MLLLIVNYHYYRESTYPSGIYPVSPAAFSHQVEVLANTYRFVSQDELHKWFQSLTFPEGDYCLLTFDDGLKEQMDAFGWLCGKGIPAIFYVPTDAIQHNSVLDVHKLHYVRAHRDDAFLFELLDKTFCISRHTFDTNAIAVQYRYDSELARKIKYFLNFELDEHERERFIGQAFEELVEDEATFSSKFYMDKQDLQKLADAGSLGSHGASHRPLAKLQQEEAKSDITQSLHLLESWTGRSVSSFAYPFGGTTAVSESLAQLFEGTSVSFALTMSRGINLLDDLRRLFFLKRVDTNDAPGGKNWSGRFY